MEKPFVPNALLMCVLEREGGGEGGRGVEGGGGGERGGDTHTEAADSWES